MIYKNAIKVLFSNFSTVWKMMLYFLLVFLFGGVLLFLCVNPILKTIEDAGFFTQFVDMYAAFLDKLDLPLLFENFAVLLQNIFEFVSTNINQLWTWFLGIFVVTFFLNSFLLNLVNMPTCMSLHLYIGSMHKGGFFSSFGDSFAKNLKFNLIKWLVALPVNILYFGIFLLSLKLFGISWYMNILAVFIIIIGFIVLFAFKTMLFALWCPTHVVLNYGIWKSLKTAIKTVFKRFGRYFSNAIGIVITIFVINVLLGLCTFVVGILLSIPLSYMLYNVYGMVSIYEGQGMRYYVDVYNVITPSKKETTDKLKDMKFVV